MIYVSATILLLSILLIILSSHLHWNIALNMGFGLFGSSFVTLIIYFFEYFVEKKKNFGLFYTKSINIMNAIGSIKYFEFNDQSDALMMYWLFKNQMGNKETLNSFYKEMLEKARKYKPEFNLSQKDFELLSYNNVELFKKCAVTYLDFMKSDFMELGLIFGDSKYLIPFLSKKQVRNIRDIYDYIMFLCKEVNQKTGIIYSFVNGEPARISYKLLKSNYCSLNDIFFFKEETNGKDLIYAKAYDELFDKLEIARSNFYHKKYIKKEHYPKFENLSNY